jgi:lysophospholipase L1-like esterase
VLATLSEDGADTDQWIGNACATASRRTVAVTYAPRSFTNHADLFRRGAFTALVSLDTGEVTKLPLLGSLAYYSPGCGTGEQVIFTQGAETRTRLVPVDAATRTPGKPVVLPGQVTSAVPIVHGVVAAEAGRVVKIAPDGTRTTVAETSGVPFELHPDAGDGVVFLDHRDADAQVKRAEPAGDVRVLAEGPLESVGLGADGDIVHITGAARTRPGALPRFVRKLDTTKDARISGGLVLTGVASRAAWDADPSDPRRTVRISGTDAGTGQPVGFDVPAGASVDSRPSPVLRTGSARAAATGSVSDPIEGERTCAVPRNDPRNQAMQPKPRQVEWAVDQAVTGSLDVARPAGWKNLGMPAYTPQGYFPPVPLAGGGQVPAQIYLGVLAQESNLWQAPGSVVPGVTGNPLIGNFYGLDLYDGDAANDWTVDWDAADCGYGVAQVTDGMRRTAPGAGPTPQQRAVALDFAANVAAGLRILQDKWNQTRSAGLVVNNGDPAKLENWFYAVWAYNSGFHLQAEAAANGGAWGVGWSNNPVNPDYPANRSAFLEVSYADAAHPQDWPYPEKVLGWAGHPVEVLESPGTLVAGYRAAWWNGDETTGPLNRSRVKPPVELFCDSSNSCHPGQVVGPAGPCGHVDASGSFDYRCWYNRPATWKVDCAYSCGNELLRFPQGYAYQDDGTAYPPACGLAGLPSGALVVDDQPDSIPSVRPGCGHPFTNQGTFSFDFGADATGHFPSKVDLHQLGAGFGGHFYYAHTRAADVRQNSMRVTGTWTLNRPVSGWLRVLVHLPDHGAQTQRARYEVDLGNGVRSRVVAQRRMSNSWVSLGSFPFAGTPKVRLSSVVDDDDQPVGFEDVAYDAVAFQPLPGKPGNIVVSLGDSYSSGEGASSDGGGDYYPESDSNGDDPDTYNRCHRSTQAWSRKATLAGSATPIGSRADSWDPAVDHHLIACSGAQTENLLPRHTVLGPTFPQNAFGKGGTGQAGEVSQLDRGFLDADTTLVTLSIGGNDARFGTIIELCLTNPSCYEHTLAGDSRPLQESEPDLIDNQVRSSVLTVLREVRAKAPNAQIVLMGYPRLLSGVCVIGLQGDEKDWLNGTADRLDTVLGQVAAAAGPGVRYSDPRDEFDGKGVCGSPESVRGLVAGWNRTPGEQTDVRPSQQSFHPNIAGQALYADALNSTLRELGL